jgi:putative aldouronate transport system permease protein
MILPALILVIIFRYGSIAGIIMAFQKLKPGQFIFGAEWVGLKNFKYVFSMPDTMQIIWNTLVISFFKIIFLRVFAVSLSLLLNEVRSTIFKRTVQSIVYIPHFFSWVILGGIMLEILSPGDGIVNHLIKALGVKPIFFLGDLEWIRFTLISSHVWKEIGWATIIYLAAITSINPSYYEAAVIDGANRWKQTWYITFPGMMPVILLTVVLSLGTLLDAGFEQVFNLYNPMVYQKADILDTAVYRLGITQGRYGVATALGLFRSVVSCALISSAYYSAYKFADYRIF